MTERQTSAIALTRRAVARGLTVGLIAAAVTMLVRQRHEARRVAEGALPRASAAADVPLQHRHGAVATAVANWLPARPDQRYARIAAGLWSAPLTVLGYSVALLAGRRPTWDPLRGCFVARGVSGASRLLHRFVGADANTIGQVVLVSSQEPSDALLDHESAHVRQAERLGPLIVPLYVWWGARYGYRDHPLEVAARRFARVQSTPTKPRSLPT